MARLSWSRALAFGALFACACQTLLDFRRYDRDDAGTNAQGALDATDPGLDVIANDVETVDAALDGSKDRSVLALRNLSAITSGLAVGRDFIYWVEGATFNAVGKDAADAGAIARSLDCMTRLYGPIYNGSRAYVACGSAPNGSVAIHSLEDDAGLGPAQPTFYGVWSTIFGLAIDGANAAVTLVTSTGYCYAVVNGAPVGVKCMPGVATANKDTFFFANADGGITTRAWTSTTEGALQLPGKAASLAADNTYVFWATARGVGRTALDQTGKEFLDDGGAASALALYATRIAFIRDGGVFETTTSLSNAKRVWTGKEDAKLVAIDADGIYFVAGTVLYVAAECPGRFCAANP